MMSHFSGVSAFRLVLASGNRNKHSEFAGFFKSYGAFEANGVELLGPDDVLAGSDSAPEAEESGGSYEENALIKARTWADFSGAPAIADDSGLEVRRLGWAPGIYSARAANGSDEDRVSCLLGELGDASDRAACFVACLVIAFPACLARPGRGYFSVEGRCWGRITASPRGDGGFGYDPIFVPDGCEKTFAELGEKKSGISHRAIAVKGVAQIIPSVLKYYAMCGLNTGK
ncbi:MAG: non-canonical purine NTP pyrophosphatase, RdgB/HAM1 family [Synergistaceae bacterium]|jgi:XTP/dITP diphosphohydrolase|nr:non-canonical purine NTP pyrophosphatase, RdgB/HAM1 family [Synergistaceae bacterium]